MWTSIGLAIGKLIVQLFGEWLNVQHKPIAVSEGEDAGAAKQAAADAQARADAEQKVVQAAADAPTTKDELVKELEDGSF